MEISLKKIIFVQDISNAKLMEFKKLIDRGVSIPNPTCQSSTLFIINIDILYSIS